MSWPLNVLLVASALRQLNACVELPTQYSCRLEALASWCIYTDSYEVESYPSQARELLVYLSLLGKMSNQQPLNNYLAHEASHFLLTKEENTSPAALDRPAARCSLSGAEASSPGQ